MYIGCDIHDVLRPGTFPPSVSGCDSIDVWISMIRVKPTHFSKRIQKKIKEMHELVSKYPILDPENENVTHIMGLCIGPKSLSALGRFMLFKTKIMGLLRVKFWSICATLNMKLQYIGYPKALESNDIQF
uniref:Uncharacterized protein n=1 Tax=Lactuca sativa TaxID=4236 RepID=A0A9R1W994_LACSA|nr:hypothetical protein LSAT_V11C200052350 [Lactuca sativa]